MPVREDFRRKACGLLCQRSRLRERTQFAMGVGQLSQELRRQKVLFSLLRPYQFPTAREVSQADMRFPVFTVENAQSQQQFKIAVCMSGLTQALYMATVRDLRADGLPVLRAIGLMQAVCQNARDMSEYLREAGLRFGRPGEPDGLPYQFMHAQAFACKPLPAARRLLLLPRLFIEDQMPPSEFSHGVPKIVLRTAGPQAGEARFTEKGARDPFAGKTAGDGKNGLGQRRRRAKRVEDSVEQVPLVARRQLELLFGTSERFRQAFLETLAIVGEPQPQLLDMMGRQRQRQGQKTKVLGNADDRLCLGLSDRLTKYLQQFCGRLRLQFRVKLQPIKAF